MLNIIFIDFDIFEMYQIHFIPPLDAPMCVDSVFLSKFQLFFKIFQVFKNLYYLLLCLFTYLSNIFLLQLSFRTQTFQERRQRTKRGIKKLVCDVVTGWSCQEYMSEYQRSPEYVEFQFAILKTSLTNQVMEDVPDSYFPITLY